MYEADSVVASDSGTGGGFSDAADSAATGQEVGMMTTMPLMLQISAYQDQLQRHHDDALPKLPSHRFRYSVWHDLTHTSVKGSEMKAPRVRDGPPEKEKFFYKIRDENNQRIHHSKKGRERKDYRDQTEDWENVMVANLPYQELGQRYQRENFLRVLRRLIRVKQLNLFHNELQDISSLGFPICTHLNISMGYICSFKGFPKTPRVEQLYADDNKIESLDGIRCLKKTPIVSLSLLRNPICFTLNYRQSIFHELPQLQVLDGVARQESDDDFVEDTEPRDGLCAIM